MSTTSRRTPRLVYPAFCVQAGDLIRIRPDNPSENTPPAYILRVTRVESVDSYVKIHNDHFAIAYTVPKNTRIEVLDFTRTVYFQCIECDPHTVRNDRTGARPGTPVVLNLDNFLNTTRYAYASLPVLRIEPQPSGTEIGYCDRHAPDVVATLDD